eukprot:Gb_28330 [translate_table: standard]
MFEGLVHQLLVGYLGNYCKDIQKEQFRIGLWKGEVLLENVDLILEAFDYLQLPFAIKQGVIGKLSIKIPWKKLGWDPILIALEDVFICTCQRDDSEWSTEAVETRELAGKRANLAAAELAKLSRRVSDSQAGQSFISYLSAKILDNIQVTIQNVHIRYVDQKPDSRVHFSFGLRFSTLTIMTTDLRAHSSSAGTSAGAKLKGGQVHKLVEIHDMCFYWNSREGYSNEQVIENVHGGHLFSDLTLESGEFNYVLKPLNATLSLMVSKSGRFERSSPQYSVALDLNDLVLALNDIQIHQMLILWDSITIYRLREKYGRFRPRNQPMLDRYGVGWQILWWQYAIAAVLSDVRKKMHRTSWSTFGLRMAARRKYVGLYRLKLERLQQGQHLDDVNLHELEEMEKELDMDEILNYRSVAESQLQLMDLSLNANGLNLESNDKDTVVEKHQSEERAANRPRGWLNWLSLGMLGAGGTTDSSQFAGVISDELIKDIYEATKYHPVSSLDSGNFLKGHCFLLSISINIHQIIATLKSMRKNTEIVCTTVHGARMNSNVWQDSARISIQLNSLKVVDPSANDLPFSCVPRDKGNVHYEGFHLLEAPGDSSVQVLTIDVEILPQTCDLDLSVKVTFQLLEFVYNAVLLETIFEFLHVLTSFQSHLDLVLSSLNGFENVGARVLSKAEYVFSNRKRVLLEVNIQNAAVIFPWRNSDSSWSRMVISMESMRFGSVLGESALTQKFNLALCHSFSDKLVNSSNYELEDDQAILTDFYDHFEIKLYGVQGKLGSPEVFPDVSFIRSFDASMIIDLCLLRDEPTMNQLKVHGALPSLHIYLSSIICITLKDFCTDLKLKHGGSKNDQNEKSTADMHNVVRYQATINLELLFLELCIDDEDQTYGENLMVLAKVENFNVRSVQRVSGCELRVGIRTINIEGCNLAGSPLSCILCSKKVGSIRSSSSGPDDNSDSNLLNAFHLKELERGIERECFYLCSWQDDLQRPTMKIYLSTLDCHYYPIVSASLYRFFSYVMLQEDLPFGTKPVEDTPLMNMGKEEGTQQSDPGMKHPNFDISTVSFEGSDSLAISFEHFPFLCFDNTPFSNSPDEPSTVDSPKHRKHTSVFDKTVNSADMKAHTKLPVRDKLGSPAAGGKTIDDDTGTDSTIASGKHEFVIQIEVDHTEIHFHDSVCILATVVIPKSKSYVFLSGNKDSWDLMASMEDVKILSSWAPVPYGEILWGPLVRGSCPRLGFRVSKRMPVLGYSELEMRFSLQHVRCILSSDYLAILIGYFGSFDWKTNSKMKAYLQESNEDVKLKSMTSYLQYKVEVIDSVVLLPVEEKCSGFLELGLPQLLFTFIPSCIIPNRDRNVHNEGISAVYLGASRMCSIDVACRQLSLLFGSVKKDEQGVHGKDVYYSSGNPSLIERLNADLSIRIQSGTQGSCEHVSASTSIVFNAQSFEANILETFFLSGLEAIVDVALELSVVGTMSKLFVSSVPQFMQSKLEFKYANISVSEVSKESSVDVKCFMSHVLLKLLRSQEAAPDVIELIGKADVRQLEVSGFWRNESLDAMAVGLSSLNLFSSSNSIALLKCISKDSTHPGIKVVLSTFPAENYNVSVAVPCVDVWVHSSAWCEICLFVTSLIETHASMEEIAPSQSLDTGFTETVKFTSAAQSRRGISDSNALRLPRPFHMKSEPLCISFHIPDFASQDEVSLSAGETNNQQGLYQHASSIRLDDKESDHVGVGRFHKFVFFSFSVCLDELMILDWKWNIKARISQIEGKLETFQEQCVQCLPFCHISEVEVEGNICCDNLEPVKVTLDFQINTVDFWFSYPMLCFWHNFNTGASNGTSPIALKLSVDVGIGVRKTAFLLSDGRWSCNAPIMEIFLRHITAHAKWSDGTLEVSVSWELQINYHNIHKVTWEPFLEPWSMQCQFARKFGRNGLFNSSPGINVYLESSSHLNINLTEALMQAAVRGSEMMKDAWGGIESDECPGSHLNDEYGPLGITHIRRYAPYFLQNDTGVPLNFWLMHGSVISESSEILDRAVRSAVQAGFSVPLFVEETPEELFCRRRSSHSSERLTDRKASGTRHHMICIQLEGTSRASMPISMDLVGLRSFEVDFSKSFGTEQTHEEDDLHTGISMQEEKVNKIGSNSRFILPVIFEVSIQRYSKLVRLYSTVTLVNATSVSLEVRFDIPFGISPKVMDPILPGQELPLPVHLAETGRIRWRPLGSSYLWSEAQSLTNILSQENRMGLSRSFVCYPYHPSNGPFRCCISVQESAVPCCYGMKQDSFNFRNLSTRKHLNRSGLTGNNFSSNRNKTTLIRQITLTAPLVVKNCLPVALELLIENGAGVNVNASAPEGDAVSIFDIDSVHDLGIAFHVSGFFPSFVKFARPTVYSTELGKVKSHAEKFVLTETLILNPDSAKGPPVYVKVEKGLDAVCGARELCLSVPFWLYNCCGLILGVTDGDIDNKINERVISGSYSAINQEELTSGKSGMAIACFDLPKTVGVQNDKTFRGEMFCPNSDMPCKIRSHLPCQKILSSCVPAQESAISGIHSHNDMHRWQKKGSNLSFSDIDANLEVGGRRTDQLPNAQACMYSPAKGLQTREPTLRLRLSQSKYVENVAQNPVWSHTFSLNPPGGSTTVLIPQPFSSGAFVISATSTPVLGACAGRTTAITFNPRYVISNACSRSLFYKQTGTDSFHRLGVGGHFHLHWTDIKRELLISIRFDEPGWDWSGSFLPDQLGDTKVKMRNYVTSALHMVCIEVQNASIAVGDGKSIENSDGSLGTYLILLSDDDTGFIPYRIDNFSMERLRFYQEKCEKFENVVQPYTCCSYAWDEPCHPHRLIIEVPGKGVVGAYGLDDVRDYKPVHLPTSFEKSERKLFVSVHAEGPIKVLSITSADVHTLKDSSRNVLYRFGEKHAPTDQRQETSVELNEKLTVCLSFIGLSMIDSVPQELAFACARGIKIEISQGLHQQKFFFQIASIQMDNQLPHAIYPVMVSIDNFFNRSLAFQEKIKEDNINFKGDNSPDGSYEGSHEAAFYLSAAKWRHMATSVNCFESITVRLAPIRLEFEEQMVSRLVDFVKSITWRFSRGRIQAQNFDLWPLNFDMDHVRDYFADHRNYEFVKNPYSSHLHFFKITKTMDSYKSLPSPSAVRPIGAPWQKIFLLARRRRKLYIEIFYIAPIKLTVSFSSTPWLPKDDRRAATQSLMWVSSTSVQRGLMALVDVEGAPIYLRQLTFTHPLASWDAIRGMVLRHYTRQLLHEVYKVLGSVGVFGNPMGFARNLGFGIRDFISVPAKSIVQNPTELITGVAQGTKSLLRNTVFAVSNAATQFSKSARKGVAAFAFDEEFVAEMERRQQGQDSHNQGVLNEFLEGLTGLLQSPIRGAEKHGLPGVVSGMVVGATGLIARIVVSILEVSGRTAQSIRNRSNPRQLNHFRVRLPRTLIKESPLLPYIWEEAVGTMVLQEVESNRLKDEVYVTCMALGLPGMFLVVTERLLLKVKSASLAAIASLEITIPVELEWNIELEIALDNIIHVDREGRFLNILAGSPQTYMRRPKDPRTLKQNCTPHFVPFIQETIELLNEHTAQELLCLIWSLIDELNEQSSQCVLRRRDLK